MGLYKNLILRITAIFTGWVKRVANRISSYILRITLMRLRLIAYNTSYIKFVLLYWWRIVQIWSIEPQLPLSFSEEKVATFIRRIGHFRLSYFSWHTFAGLIRLSYEEVACVLLRSSNIQLCYFSLQPKDKGIPLWPVFSRFFSNKSNRYGFPDWGEKGTKRTRISLNDRLPLIATYGATP